jgi:hypothetical protein
MKNLLPILTLVLVSSLAAKADLLTVNFDAPGGLGGTNYAGPGADTGGATNEYWNAISFDGTTSAGLASDGSTATGVTFTDSSYDYVTSGGPTAIPLFTPFLRAVGTADTETLNNVQAGVYDLYIYSQNGGFEGRGGIFTLGSTVQTVGNDGSDHSSFIEGTNYTEFTNITLETAGSIAFSYQPYPPQYGEGDLNGVQLVEIATVPEPSTWAMFLGGAGLIAVMARVRNLLRL